MRFGASGLNQPLRGGNEVVKCYLPIPSLGCVMPFRPELGTTANVRQCKETASLDEKRHKHAELWSHGDSIASIRSHDGGTCASLENFWTANEEYGNLFPVFRREPSLCMTETLGVKGDLPFCPERYLGSGMQVATGLNRFRKRLLFEEELAPILGASQHVRRVPLVDRDLAEWFAR